MRCFIVAVNYPILELTLAYNLHHFESVHIITDTNDTHTHKLCKQFNVSCYQTDAFYRSGAYFNKWLALEEGLDFFGRSGWLWIMDADIFLPKRIVYQFNPGNLYTPHRRMAKEFIPEQQWNEQNYPPNMTDFNGYSHIFHSSDEYLPPTPWYQTDWIHAGGADTFFQRNWPTFAKVRPNFEVLHVGPAGTNWCGVGNQTILQQIRSYKTPDYKHERIQLPHNTN